MAHEKGEPNDIAEQSPTQEHSFAESTPFHGVIQYAHSINTIEKIMWLLLVLFCAALTLKDVVGSLDDYISKATVSTTIIQRSAVISYPATAVCVEYDVDGFGGIANHQINTNDSDTVADFFKNNTHLFEIAGLVRSNGSLPPGFPRHGLNTSAGFPLVTGYFGIKWNEIFVNSNLSNDAKKLRSGVLLTALMLNQLSVLENQIVDQEAAEADNGTFKRVSKNPLASPVASWVYNYYVNKSVDFDHLTQVTGAWLCVFMDLYIIHIKIRVDEEDRTEDVCKQLVAKRRVLWIGVQPWLQSAAYGQVCFQLDDDTARADEKGNGFTFDAKRSKSLVVHLNDDYLHFDGYDRRNASFDNPSYGPQIHFNFGGWGAGFHNRTTSSLSADLDNKKTGKEQAFELQLNGVYNELPEARDACDPKGDWSTCYSLCFEKTVEAYCKCRSHSWSKFFPPKSQDEKRLPLCSDPSPHLHGRPWASALSCQGVIANQSWWDEDDPIFDSCLAQCKPSCKTLMVVALKTVFPEIAVAIASDYDVGNDTAKLFFFTVSQFVFPVTNESIKVDLPTMFSNVGGNLGLWIGGSFLAIVHLIVWAVKWCYFHNKKKKTLAPGAPEKAWRAKFEDLISPRIRMRPTARQAQNSDANTHEL